MKRCPKGKPPHKTPKNETLEIIERLKMPKKDQARLLELELIGKADGLPEGEEGADLLMVERRGEVSNSLSGRALSRRVQLMVTLFFTRVISSLITWPSVNNANGVALEFGHYERAIF